MTIIEFDDLKKFSAKFIELYLQEPNYLAADETPFVGYVFNPYNENKAINIKIDLKYLKDAIFVKFDHCKTINETLKENIIFAYLNKKSQ